MFLNCLYFLFWLLLPSHDFYRFFFPLEFYCNAFYLFIQFVGFSWQVCWNGLPFPPPVDHILSVLSTMTCPSWMTLHWPYTVMAHSFIELHKPLCHDNAVIHEGDGWHQWINGYEPGLTLGGGKGNGRLCAAVHGVMKSWTWLGDWTTTTAVIRFTNLCCYMFQMPPPCLMLVFLPFLTSKKEFCVITLCKRKEYAWELR